MKESLRNWGKKLSETNPPQIEPQCRETPRNTPRGLDPGRLRPCALRRTPLNLSELPYTALISPQGAAESPSLGLDFKESGPGGPG